ncbi:MAG: nucleotidyltransferase, partial [Thaumarchaeota archaeon]|nr:nucleotidyltransferase [Nitrososphaerota archaeon]
MDIFVSEYVISKMTIPESQLSRWTNHGSQDNSKRTHESIRNALDCYQWPEQMTFDFSLQGSYKNDTNIRGDSDVDVIIKLNHAFCYECNSLSQSDQHKLKNTFQDSMYGLPDFKSHTLKALSDKFGASVIEGNKAIKIKSDSNRLAADVIVCMEYRKYTSIDYFVKGIKFFTKLDKHRIINYPNEHYKRGVEKNELTDGMYKQTVRMFKNARNHLVETRKISQNLAPSYFLECFIYNAPDHAFQGSLQDIYCSIVDWMETCDVDEILCQNEQKYLFGSSAESWTPESADELSK